MLDDDIFYIVERSTLPVETDSKHDRRLIITDVISIRKHGESSHKCSLSLFSVVDTNLLASKDFVTNHPLAIVINTEINRGNSNATKSKAWRLRSGSWRNRGSKRKTSQKNLTARYEEPLNIWKYHCFANSLKCRKSLNSFQQKENRDMKITPSRVISKAIQSLNQTETMPFSILSKYHQLKAPDTPSEA